MCLPVRLRWFPSARRGGFLPYLPPFFFLFPSSPPLLLLPFPSSPSFLSDYGQRRTLEIPQQKLVLSQFWGADVSPTGIDVPSGPPAFSVGALGGALPRRLRPPRPGGSAQSLACGPTTSVSAFPPPCPAPPLPSLMRGTHVSQDLEPIWLIQDGLISRSLITSVKTLVWNKGTYAGVRISAGLAWGHHSLHYPGPLRRPCPGAIPFQFRSRSGARSEGVWRALDSCSSL